MTKRQVAAALAGFNDAEDRAIMTRFVPETARHLLTVFDFTEIAFTEIAVDGDIKVPEKQQMVVQVLPKPP